MRCEFEHWLSHQDYSKKTISNYLAYYDRLSLHYGDLDMLYDTGQLTVLIEGPLTYSTEDERRSRSNPTPIDINGDLRTNLASYKQGARIYLEFRQSAAALTA